MGSGDHPTCFCFKNTIGKERDNIMTDKTVRTKEQQIEDIKKKRDRLKDQISTMDLKVQLLEKQLQTLERKED